MATQVHSRVRFLAVLSPKVSLGLEIIPTDHLLLNTALSDVMMAAAGGIICVTFP